MLDEYARSAIDRLIGELRGPLAPEGSPDAAEAFDIQDESYRYFASRCNGGYTPNNFYHFFGRSEDPRHDIVAWNDPNSWKSEFGLGDDFIVFAEDIFGNQYGIRSYRRGPRIRLLSIITGELSFAPEYFDDFVDLAVLNEEDKETVLLARRFLSAVPYKEYHHLSFAVPPCLGGAVDQVENLELIDSRVNLSMTGQLLAGLRQWPPGTRIRDVRLDRENGAVALIPQAAGPSRRWWQFWKRSVAGSN